MTGKNFIIKKIKKPTFISLFSGGGGSSLGYRMAGYRELLAIDFNKNAIEVFKLNFPNVPVWQKDIRNITGKEIIDFCGIPDILDGSPPCQGFSTSGKRKVIDIRNNLVMDYIRLVKEIQPKVFVMENVQGMAQGIMKGLFNKYLDEMKKSGYVVKCKLMNAMYYNVPQSRERLIFIGIRNDLKIEPSFPKRNMNIITASQAIKHLENKYKEEEKLYFIKQGKLEFNFGSSSIRIYSHKPVNTQKCAGGTKGGNLNIHYKKNRRLSILEFQILQGFPETFKFTGSKRQQVDCIGNSVPPKMIEAIAKHLKERINKR